MYTITEEQITQLFKMVEMQNQFTTLILIATFMGIISIFMAPLYKKIQEWKKSKNDKRNNINNNNDNSDK